MTAGLSPWGALALLLLAALALFHRPLGRLLRLAVRSSVGLAALALFSQAGAGRAGGARIRAAAHAPVGAAIGKEQTGGRTPYRVRPPV